MHVTNEQPKAIAAGIWPGSLAPSSGPTQVQARGTARHICTYCTRLAIPGSSDETCDVAYRPPSIDHAPA